MADGHSDARILRHLLPDNLRKTFIERFQLHSQEEVLTGAKKIVAKFFFPAGRYTFYAIEGEPEGSDFVFYGYCISPVGEDCDEWGYVTLSEFLSIRLGPLHMERDIHFPVAKQTISEVCPKADFSAAAA
ncbi:MAG: DUF2958 domain-containing protein [Acidobacteriota bacterium]